MKKIVYPVFEKCPVHPNAVTNARGNLELEIDLKKAFHYGYLLSYGHQLKPGQNPLFSLYKHSLDAGRELRFLPPGVAADSDSRTGSSSMLGRCFALGVLNQLYGYTWFASISNLRNTPLNGWGAETKAVGDSPDFLAGNHTDFAVAEAKGTHKHISISSSKVADWRTQVNNIIIKKDGTPVRFKTWLIATRFVLNTQARINPEMLIEDPAIDGRRLSENDVPTLSFWIACDHTIRNLERLRLYNLIIRIREPELSKTYALIWQCIHPKLDHLRFVGNPIDFNTDQFFPFWDIDHHLHPEERARIFNRRLPAMSGGFFDGLELSVVRNIIDGRTPDRLEYSNGLNDLYDFISLLSDGSFIAPLNLMRLIDVKDL
jgi:hypothetical protein